MWTNSSALQPAQYILPSMWETCIHNLPGLLRVTIKLRNCVNTLTISCSSHWERDEGKGLGNATVISALIYSSWRGGNHGKIWHTVPTGPTQRTVSYHTVSSDLQVAGRNPELHSLGVQRNCQQFLKATTPIPSPIGHIPHHFHA